MSNRLKVFKKTLPLKNFITSGGTWNFVTNAGIPYISKTVADTTTLILIPIDVPQSHESGQGVKLKSLDIPIRVATEDLDSTPVVTLYRRNMDAVTGATADMVASTITCTTAGATVTKDANDRLITLTVDSPALDYDTDAKLSYFATLRLNAKDSSAIRVYDAIAYFEVPV